MSSGLVRIRTKSFGLIQIYMEVNEFVRPRSSSYEFAHFRILAPSFIRTQYIFSLLAHHRSTSPSLIHIIQSSSVRSLNHTCTFPTKTYGFVRIRSTFEDLHIPYELLIILAHPIRVLDHYCTLHTTDASSSTVDALSTQDLHFHYKSRNKPLQTATMVEWEHA